MKNMNINSNRILYIQYTNPASYPPLEHSSQILVKQGFKILFLGIRVLETDDLKFSSHPQITVYKMPLCPPGWKQKLHYLAFSLWIFIWVFRWQPEWIYASDLLSCPISYILSFIPKTKIIYHEHDSPGEHAHSFFVNLCLKARVKLAQRVQFSVLPNQLRCEKFALQVKPVNPIFCVWNCPGRDEVLIDQLPESLSDDESLWLWHHGSIVPSQLPLTLIHALKVLPSRVKLKIAGYETIGHPGYIAELLGLADALNIADRVEYLGTLKRQKLLESCSCCDIGLALFVPPIREPMAGASNKPFDYLACGLPLVVPDLPDWQAMYVEPGYALACNPQDPASIAAAIGWYLDHPTEMKAMGEQGRRRILTDWNYEAQFSVVKHQLSQPLLQANQVISLTQPPSIDPDL
jgi:glycosyltransferase involved in cell wall biosynthesis